jgi:hypothetical protein
MRTVLAKEAALSAEDAFGLLAYLGAESAGALVLTDLANPRSAAMDARRRHVIDTCQLLNKARVFKYTAAQVSALEQAAEQCREKAATRFQLFDWLLFNALIGNGDNHLKNLSFIVDSSGVHIAPAYDLLSTAAYDTKALANEGAHWPQSPLAITLGDSYLAVAMDASQPPPNASISATLACNRVDSTLSAVSSALNRVV